MSWPHAYSLYVWPMLAIAGFEVALAIFALRRRSVPGALWLALTLLTGVPMALSSALKVMAVEVPVKVFWLKFQSPWPLTYSTVWLCFALEYANLSRWLTRRTLELLSIPVLVVLLLALTNGFHHWLWRGIPIEPHVSIVKSTAFWILAGYCYLLVAAAFLILLWLFMSSPMHRWPLAIIMFSQVLMNGAYTLDLSNANPLATMELAVLAAPVCMSLIAVPLFGYHMFDLVPVARGTVIEQMREGMLILDAQQRVVDVNRAAQRILGMPAGQIRGRDAGNFLPGFSGSSALTDGPGTSQSELSLGTGAEARHYALHLSSLTHRTGYPLGYLLLLHDVTEQKRTQAQVLAQQRVMATLEERERLAREMHDSVGQVLGYVSMQAQAICKRVHDGETAAVEGQLRRLANVAQDAHGDIRESILNLQTSSAQEWSFLTALRQHVKSFREHYGIGVELTIPHNLEEDAFGPGVGVQLLRVIQEAMTNARKHGHARCIRVVLEVQDGRVRIIVADEGSGFDPHRSAAGMGGHLGLTFMRERTEQIGGRLTIQSQAGAGTRVVLEIPTPGNREEPRT